MTISALPLSAEEFEVIAKAELTEKELTRIDMLFLGTMIYDFAFSLSRKVNEELLEPINKWLCDPEWLSKFKVLEEKIPDWAAYKKNQRQWTKQQKHLAAERLKLYWQEIQRKKAFRNELSKITATRSKSEMASTVKIAGAFIPPIISPFSPPEQHKAQTKQEFLRALALPVSDLLPWKPILQTELINAKKLTDLRTYYEDSSKKDTASKLIHLLEMEKQGRIAINQEEAFGDITIKPLENPSGTAILVTDQQGKNYEFDWQHIGDNQRAKIIRDIKAHKILCRQAEAR